MDSVLLHTGVGIQSDADTTWSQLQQFLPTEVRRRLLMYLSGYRHQIKLHPVGRDGSGTELTVNILDTAVHEVLRHICVLYPAALRLGKRGVFTVTCGPLLW